MRKLIFRAGMVIACSAIVAGGCLLWRQRPWRVAVKVNGHILTVGELELRTRTLLDDALRVERLVVQPGHEEEVRTHYRRQAAKMWIVKEVLLSEALVRGFAVSPADEKEALEQMALRIKGRNLTPESFFKEGPLPEDLKRRDFKEGMLVNKFTLQEVSDKISVTPKEIDERLNELQKIVLMQSKPGTKAQPPSRKHALDSLRGERFREGFRKLFRDLFVKADVKSPIFPDLESLDVISPAQGEAESHTKEQK